jgi:hypothetical protein
VDLDSPAIQRRPARDLDPDSDLGDRLVTVSVGALSPAEIDTALARGLARAADYHRRGLIADGRPDVRRQDLPSLSSRNFAQRSIRDPGATVGNRRRWVPALSSAQAG